MKKNQNEQLSNVQSDVYNINSKNDKFGEDFPSSISIIDAFDDVIGCYSINGYIKNYYRYGKINFCDYEKKKLWFSFKNGSLFLKRDKDIINEHEKSEKIKNFYKKLFLEKKSQCSENLWIHRTDFLDNPFPKNFEEYNN